MRVFQASFLLLLILPACSDYEIFDQRQGESEGLGDTGGLLEDTGVVVTVEECNGEDDDGDGAVDEGFSDIDFDGIADCVDESCLVEIPEARDVAISESCKGASELSDDPWDIVVEWQWTGVSSDPDYHSVMMSPAIGNLTDDNGDGAIDELDTPDVVFVAMMSGWGVIMPGYLVVLDGATGAEHWVKHSFSGYTQVTIVDVDADGVPEILVGDSKGFGVQLLDNEGQLIWSGGSRVTVYPLVADVDDDGLAEILAGDELLDADTGSLLETVDTTRWVSPALGDLDQDGVSELIYADGVWDASGSRLWNHLSVPLEQHAWPIVVDVDGDAGGEIVVVSSGRLVVYDEDGSVLSDNSTMSVDLVWLPCAADFDGDGQVEVAYGDRYNFHVVELDGTEVWRSPTKDTSGASSCSAFDFNADGSYEVVYSDEDNLWLFDGKTGGVLFNDTSHASGTLVEYPTVADIDGDNSAEIVAPSMFQTPWFGSIGGIGGVTAYGQADNGWAPAGPTWNAFNFAESNYNSDSTVVGTTAPWLSHNLSQGRPPLVGAGTDLAVGIEEVCFSACESHGEVRVAVQIGNEGGEDVDNDVQVALYADNGGELTLIDVQTVSGGVSSGRAVEGIEFVFSADEYGTDGVVARVDDDGTMTEAYEECEEDNNVAAWTETYCD